MATQKVCDFCRKPSFIGNEIKVRGRRFAFLRGALSRGDYKLELCDKCYDDMVVYIATKRRAKLEQGRS